MRRSLQPGCDLFRRCCRPPAWLLCHLYVPGHEGGSALRRTARSVEHPGKLWQLFPDASQIANCPVPSNSSSLTTLKSDFTLKVNTSLGVAPVTNVSAVATYSLLPAFFQVPYCAGSPWARASAEARKTPPRANEMRTWNGVRPDSGGGVTPSA